MPSKDTDVIFNCVVKNIYSTKHNKKRQLKGNRRARAANAMIKERKEAIIYRREEAKRLKAFGDNSPPMLPSTAVLRKAKEERLLNQHGLMFSNPVLNLLNNAKYGKYAGSIINIGLLPFCCMYWTPEQQLLYTARLKRDPEAFLTIDATGGIVKRESSQEPPIFLYQCVLSSKDGSVPVYQMMSADHRALMISFFLRNIIARNVPIPRTVVTDFSWALLIAISDVFAKCVDLRDYLKKCYDIIVLKNIVMLPACYIRLDVSHLIKMVAKWKCLKGKEKMLVRVFTLRCVSQAYLMNSFKEIEYLIESILSVTLSKTIGCSIDGKPVMSDVRMQYLNDIIKGNVNGEIETIINDDDSNENEDQEKDSPIDDIKIKYDNTDWIQWSNSVLDAAKRIADESECGTIINACYNPDFAKQFKTRLLSYLPIWTGIMRPYFRGSSEIASSSAVEAEFCDLKHRGFKSQLPIKVDKFIVQHLDFLDAKITLASNENDGAKNTSLQSNKKDTTCDSMEVDDDSMEIVTNNHELSITDIDIESDNDKNNFKQLFEDNITDTLSDISVKSTVCALDTDLDNKNENNWNIRENWHGLANSSNITDSVQELPETSTLKTRSKPSYLDKCPEWDF